MVEGPACELRRAKKPMPIIGFASPRSGVRGLVSGEPAKRAKKVLGLRFRLSQSEGRKRGWGYVFLWVLIYSKSIDVPFSAACMSRVVPLYVAFFGFSSLAMSRIVRLYVA